MPWNNRGVMPLREEFAKQVLEKLKQSVSSVGSKILVPKLLINGLIDIQRKAR